MDHQAYTVMSLFSGAGGMDMGLERAGMRVIWANDIDEDACATYSCWSSATVYCGDVSEVDFRLLPATDIIVGGFPCQGFSLAGPRKIDDKRNALYRHFVRAVADRQPYAFIAENVKGILSLGGGTVLDAIIEDFKSKGYNVSYKLLNAADYGVPQHRERVFFVGLRNDIRVEYQFPEPLEKRVTLEETLKDLPEPHEDDVCQDAYSSRFMSRNRRRDWSGISYTIPAMAKQVPLHPSSPHMKKVHKDLWVFGVGVTRRLSWQEAAAIQTFPRGMVFEGSLNSKYRQIGNAVPVRLAQAVGQSLVETLDKHFACIEEVS